MKKNIVIIVLGSTNDENGTISNIGLQRLKKGIEVYKYTNNAKLILTGGFGKHFNKSNHPYSFYAKNFVISEGIKETDILDFVLSKDTIEDAQLSLPVVKSQNFNSIIIITSDFHMNRVNHIFKKVFEGYELTFVEIKYEATEEELSKLREIEDREMNMLVETGRSSIGSIL